MHEELKKVISESINTRFEFEQKLIHKAWEDEKFKQELLINPKAVFERESGQEIPKHLEIQVIQETANNVYLVLPKNPVSSVAEGELNEEALEAIAGGVWACAASFLGGEVCLRKSKIRNANDKV